MGERWYWRTGDRIQGPFTTAELDRLIHSRRATDTDRIRLEGTHDWLTIAEVRGVFDASVEQSSAGAAAQAAARALARADRAKMQRVVEPARRRSAVVGLARAGRQWLSGLFSSVADLLSDGAARLLKVTTLTGKRTVVGLLVIVLGVILFRQIDLGGSRNQRVYDKFARASEELQALQARESSAAQWEKFEQQTGEWLQPTLTTLEESARRDPIARTGWLDSSRDTALARQQLIFAARSLRAMLDKGEASEEELQRFAGIMDLAHGYLTGERAARAKPPIPSVSGSAASEAALSDPFMIGILALDALVIGIGIVYWWMRRRRVMG